MPSPDMELDDVQALVRTGFPGLREATFILAKVADATAARAWLASAPVTTAALKPATELALQVAFTVEGMRDLGVPEGVLTGFSQEFQDGLASDEARSRRLGDISASAPARWKWGSSDKLPGIAILIYAKPGRLSAWTAEVRTADFLTGFQQIEVLPTSDMNDDEPFGFKDGISQPELDWFGKREPGTDRDADYGNLISLGEFLLGHPNEYGLLTRRPLLDPELDPAGLLSPAHDAPGKRDLGRNGSYLVFRQLDQDVREFWRYAAKQSPADGGIGFAESMVGRKLGGGPLVTLSSEPIRGVARGQHVVNNFDYLADVDGVACPFGAHVRRANPRTGDLPGGRVSWPLQLIRMIGFGKNDDPRADLVASARFHRILRRGREYGEPLSPVAAATEGTGDPRSGLHFICIGANIERQFEFIQNAWLMSAKFNGMSGEADPLLGSRDELPSGRPADAFDIPTTQGLCRHYDGLPRFVSVRGGAYFFLPGIRALRFFAAAPWAQANSSSPVGS